MTVSGQPVTTATGRPGKPAKMRRLHPFRGFVAGLSLGIGLVILCVSFSVLVTTTYYVYVGILCGAVVLGVIIGLFGPTRTRRSVRRAASTSAAGPIVSGVPSAGSTSAPGYPAVSSSVPPPQPAPPPIDPPSAP
jgi:hypothetical protein